MLLDLLDARKSALIVIDLQNAFCHKDGTLGRSGLDTDHLSSVIPPLKKVIEGCVAADIPVVWTVQEHLEVDRRRARKRLPSHTSKRKAVSALAGSWDARIVDELADFVTDPTLVIRKHRFGAFYETRLNVLLEMLGVEALFVTGLTTNACVETTIREAYLRDFDVVGINDCIAGVNPEWEEGAKKVWRQYMGITIESADFQKWLLQQQAPAVVGLAHMLLQVSDLKKAEAFYLGTLGFQKKPDAVPLADGRPLTVTLQGLGLTSGGPGDQAQVDHIAFEVRGVAALAERIKNSGVKVLKELGPGAYGSTIYVEDPDGNKIELFEP
jgi:ureidoacrylate peracid hydrolase